MEGQSGSQKSAVLAKFHIPRTYLSLLERSGEGERVLRVVYQEKDAIQDELFGIQAYCRSAIYSRETVLYPVEINPISTQELKYG